MLSCQRCFRLFLVNFVCVWAVQIEITSPRDGDFLSATRQLEVSFVVASPPEAGTFEVGLEVNGEMSPERIKGESAATFIFQPHPQANRLHLVALLLDLDGIELSRSKVVRGRVAVDIYFESENGNYWLWMPQWLARNFEHLFETDEKGRRTMLPLEQYVSDLYFSCMANPIHLTVDFTRIRCDTP